MPADPLRRSSTQPSTSVAASEQDAESSEESDVRLPRAVQAIYLRPLKRQATVGLPACDLQLRSYSVRNLEFFADFCLRAAYYLGMPASGPIPLPKHVQRWTVARSPFVHKKSQENFERITLRRLIQIQDADPEVVQIWLAYIRKHAYYGVGMKANVWEHTSLGECRGDGALRRTELTADITDVGRTMDASAKDVRAALDAEWSRFGRKKGTDANETVVGKMQSRGARSGR